MNRKLENEKLRLEITELKKPWWRKFEFYRLMVPLVLGLFSLIYAFSSGLIDVQKRELELTKRELKFEIEGIKTEKKKVAASKDSIDKVVSLKEKELDNLKGELLFLNDSLESSSFLLDRVQDKLLLFKKRTHQLLSEQHSLEQQIKYEIKSTRFEQLYRISLDLRSMCSMYEYYRTEIIVNSEENDYSEDDKANIELIRSHIDPLMMNSWRGRRRILQSLSTRFEIGFDEYPYDDAILRFQDELIVIWNRNQEGFDVLDDIMAEYHRFSETNKFNFIKQLESIRFDKTGTDAFFNKEIDSETLEVVAIKKK